MEKLKRIWQRLRIRYNAPVVLSFALCCSLLFVLDAWLLNYWLRNNLLTLKPGGSLFHAPTLARILLYPLGHSSMEHLMGNLGLFLLIGPAMEEKYGSKPLAKMMLLTTVITGLVQWAFLSTGLLGASGLVFMLIVLISFANVQQGSIPLSFILVVCLFLGRELWQGFSSSDNISQYAHIAGGVFGGIFGFAMRRRR